MNKLWIRFVLALLITIAAAIYQRKTGPTYPLTGEKEFRGQKIEYEMLRSHGGETDQPVELKIPDEKVDAVVIYKKYKTDDPWTGMKMQRIGENLTAALPHQPPAGKLEYYILIIGENEISTIPEDLTIVTRFKGAVPDWALIPHILFMFVAMLLSITAGLEALTNGNKMNILTMWTAICLFLGGMILGPVVQKFAFGEFWTGIPFGIDLTDNKTLIAMVAWALAVWRTKTGKSARGWIIAATVILLMVYSIPHSMLGSELNYETMQVQTGD